MVVDYLRACYTTRAHLFPSQPARLSTVRWYWAASDAQPLPIPSAVNSNNWLPQEERSEVTIGEADGSPRVFNDGFITRRPRGTHYHGDPYFFENGSTTGSFLSRLPNGIPAECIEAVHPEGGLVLGGEALTWTRGGPVSCTCCPDDVMRERIAFHLVSKTGTAVDLPDYVVLSHMGGSGDCGYSGFSGDGINPAIAGPSLSGWQLVLSCLAANPPPAIHSSSLEGFYGLTGGGTGFGGGFTSDATCGPPAGTWPGIIGTDGTTITGTFTAVMV